MNRFFLITAVAGAAFISLPLYAVNKLPADMPGEASHPGRLYANGYEEEDEDDEEEEATPAPSTGRSDSHSAKRPAPAPSYDEDDDEEDEDDDFIGTSGRNTQQATRNQRAGKVKAKPRARRAMPWRR